MKLKELHSLLQDVEVFREPKVELEQYPTGPHLASRMLYTVESMFNDFEDKVVMDLGCGTGMLTIGAALVGGAHVLGVDIDEDALAVAQENCESFEDPLPVDFLQCSVANLPGLVRDPVDTVVMNPPFGTRRKGADIDFLAAALRVSRGTVYSLHKTSTRDYVGKTAKRDLGACSAEVVAQLVYDLPASYQFHKQKTKDIDVDLWRFEVRR